jgi:hypothetical protein
MDILSFRVRLHLPLFLALHHAGQELLPTMNKVPQLSAGENLELLLSPQSL